MVMQQIQDATSVQYLNILSLGRPPLAAGFDSCLLARPSRTSFVPRSPVSNPLEPSRTLSNPLEPSRAGLRILRRLLWILSNQLMPNDQESTSMQDVQPAPQRRTSDEALPNHIESYLYVRLGGGRSGVRVHQDWSPFFLSLNWLSALSAFFHPAEILKCRLVSVTFQNMQILWENDTGWFIWCPFPHLFSTIISSKLATPESTSFFETSTLWFQKTKNRAWMQPATKIFHAFSELPI